ncbi:MAG: serine/threonine-protein kinase [Gemmatimonas sp.]|nr:serine/threonine-protein kinase [Gemmatimonas sp.]
MTSTRARLASTLQDRYRVDRELGAGGMATVYLAHDVKHERDVAIKVLHPDLGAALGAERFLSEIRTTARLQHPHILPLLDSGAADGLLYYVMPYVRGETLRARLEREKQLPIADAVRIAREVAAALDHAHKQGVIHRDIKPENILLQDGAAVVADFGIALALQSAGGQRMTQTGLSLGTPQYMSPEQAMGERTIDARSDIYALGAVTYEMLTGEPPFTGASTQAIVAKVLTERPVALRTLRDTVPAGVEQAVLGALAKLPADRPDTAAAFIAAIDAGARTTTSESTRAVPVGRRAPRTGMMVAMAVNVLLAAGLAWAWFRPVAEPPVLQHRLWIDAGHPLAPSLTGGVIAISPDDRRVAMVLREGSGSAVWVRNRDAVTPTRLPGSESVGAVAFSPDARQLVGVGAPPGADGGTLELRLLSLDGGQPRQVARVDIGNEGVAWGSDGWIYFDGLTGRGTNGIERIRPDGSARERLTTVDTAQGEVDHVYPAPLPGGRELLLTVRTKAGPVVAVVNLSDRKVTRLIAGANARFLRPGWLVYSSGRLLQAVRFDVGDRRVTGTPIMLTNVGGTLSDASDITISDRGTLLYLSGQLNAPGGRPHWVDLAGRATPLDSTLPDAAVTARLSPDGRRLVYGVARLDAPGTVSLFVKALPNGVPTPVDMPPGYTISASWAADGRHLHVLSDSNGNLSNLRVWVLDAAGAEPPRQLRGGVGVGPVEAWRDRLFTFTARGGIASTTSQIAATRSAGDSTFVPLFSSRIRDDMPAVSPDGRWIAYHSSMGNGGERALWVRHFPDVEAGSWIVSIGAVQSPALWSPDSRVLYFVNQQRQVEAVRLTEDRGDVQVGERRTLFDASGYWMDRMVGWDIARDGSRFVMMPLPQGGRELQLLAIENLPALLARKASP